MKMPSKKALKELYRDLSDRDAHLVRSIGHAVDDDYRYGDDSLPDLIKEVPATDKYVRSMYSSPWDSDIWRVTVALHAINELVGGNGVEALGPPRSGDYAPPYEYINAGDPYVGTLIYSRNANAVAIGSWGDIAERHPEWE